MFESNTPFMMPVAPANSNYGSGAGWGDGGWLWIIVVFALLFGWGNNGFGGGFGGNGGYVATAATQADIQRGFDNSAVISKLDGITNGLCDGFYSVQNGMNGINTNILQTGFGIQQAINADTVSGMQNTNSIQATLTNMSAQNASCCCETQRQIERGFADTNYNMATQACQTRQAIADSTRSILDYLCQDKIATLQAENSDLRRAASQDRQNALLTTTMAAQTNQIIDAVRPTPVPSFPASNLYGYAYGCGCNTGCGC